MNVDPTTWSYKDGKRAALHGEPRSSNPCDPVTEAAREFQWFAGYDESLPAEFAVEDERQGRVA